VAKRPIRKSAEWAATIWQELRDCQVFTYLNSTAAKKSNWCTMEIGAALCLKKLVQPVRLDTARLPKSVDHIQATLKFRTEDQKRELVNHLKELCASEQNRLR
jgi:TIR domain-containing protein